MGRSRRLELTNLKFEVSFLGGWSTGLGAKDAPSRLQFLANFRPSKFYFSDSANYFEKS
jgi:hypothetical protein